MEESGGAMPIRSQTVRHESTEYTHMVVNGVVDGTPLLRPEGVLAGLPFFLSFGWLA